MKKLLLLLALIAPMIALVGCESAKRKEVKKQIDLTFANLKNDNLDKEIVFSEYKNLKLELSSRNDSLLVYSAIVEGMNGKMKIETPVEFVYLEMPDNTGEILGVNLISSNNESIIDAVDRIINEMSKSKEIPNKDIDKLNKDKEELTAMAAQMFLLSPKAIVKHINTK